MKKVIKIVLIILITLICLLTIDTLQAKLFNNRPLVGIKTNNNIKGILVTNYRCSDEKVTHFNWVKFACKEVSIPDDYIAIFHGGAGEETYETYIYKIDNGKPNSGFKYINVTARTTSYGSSTLQREITKTGTVLWTDEIFKVAEDNNAYSYVTKKDDSKTYTIEEFANIFLMN